MLCVSSIVCIYTRRKLILGWNACFSSRDEEVFELKVFCYKIVKIIKLNNLHQKLRAFRSQTTVYRLAEGKKLRSVTPIRNSLVCPKLIRISKLNVTSV